MFAVDGSVQNLVCLSTHRISGVRQNKYYKVWVREKEIFFLAISSLRNRPGECEMSSWHPIRVKDFIWWIHLFSLRRILASGRLVQISSNHYSLVNPQHQHSMKLITLRNECPNNNSTLDSAEVWCIERRETALGGLSSSGQFGGPSPFTQHL